MKKVKIEYIGKYITTYNSKGFEVSFIVTEEIAQDYEYYTSIGLEYLFEEEVKVSKKYKGIETDANTEA
jgi:hypothetical protein